MQLFYARAAHRMGRDGIIFTICPSVRASVRPRHGGSILRPACRRLIVLYLNFMHWINVTTAASLLQLCNVADIVGFINQVTIWRHSFVVDSGSRMSPFQDNNSNTDSK